MDRVKDFLTGAGILAVFALAIVGLSQLGQTDQTNLNTTPSSSKTTQVESPPSETYDSEPTTTYDESYDSSYDDSYYDSDGYYSSSGNYVESPDSNAAGATALCADGTYSHSQHRSGTCSYHGGVAERLY